MTALLSIKPKFANMIFEGHKLFEFRRVIFANKKVKKIIVYASSPLKKVIGEFSVEDIINCDIQSLWSLTKDGAGIEKNYFERYFLKKEKGYAIKIKDPICYDPPYEINELGVRPPQSFLYLRDNQS